MAWWECRLNLDCADVCEATGKIRSRHTHTEREITRARASLWLLRAGMLSRMDLSRFRRRLPLVAFVLLLVLGLLLLGFACALMTDHPVQAIERVLSAISAVPPLVDVWTVQAVALLALAFVLTRRVRSVQRSPAVLQRFLF